MKTISIKEFRDLGYLAYVNRMILHPLGLALSVEIDWPENTTREDMEIYQKPIKHPNAVWKFGEVWDYRDDPEGLIYNDTSTPTHVDNAERIEDERYKKQVYRLNKYGWLIQPIGDKRD